MQVFENQLVQLKFKQVLVVLVVDATDPLGSMVSWCARLLNRTRWSLFLPTSAQGHGERCALGLGGKTFRHTCTDLQTRGAGDACRAKLKLIVGTNPVFVAVTKCDLLPLVTPELVHSWHELVIQHYGCNVAKVFPLSGLTKGGVFRMTKHMYQHVADAQVRSHRVHASDTQRTSRRGEVAAATGADISHAQRGLLLLRAQSSYTVQRCKRLRIVTLGISGWRSLTRPFRDARRFPSTRWYPVLTCTRTTRKFGICRSFKGHFLSRRAKP